MDLKDKKVLVTGADGFIGSHLTEKLLGRGCHVKALSYYNSFNYWGWLEDLAGSDGLEVLTGDVRDPNYCRKITREVDVAFHLAALIAIPYSYIAPDSYIDTNIRGTLNICQGALENGCSKVIHTSTSEVYGTALYVPIDEKHPLQPQSPYSATKIGADNLALSFYHAFGLPLAIARPFNTYGPRQSARAVIPTIITQIASGRQQVRLGDTRPTRDLTFVTDTCEGLIAIAECDQSVGSVTNIGSGYEISIGDLFYTIRDLMGSKADILKDDQRVRPEKSEVNRLLCDNSKLFRLTGFKPGKALKEGLSDTIKWFSREENLKKYKSGIYNV
jgi:NAD dependent epimerase/dehydratase